MNWLLLAVYFRIYGPIPFFVAVPSSMKTQTPSSILILPRLFLGRSLPTVFGIWESSSHVEWHTWQLDTSSIAIWLLETFYFSAVQCLALEDILELKLATLVLCAGQAQN
ncbi:unnamed protein product, partial [Protopolystoma xenopodis]